MRYGIPTMREENIAFLDELKATFGCKSRRAAQSLVADRARKIESLADCQYAHYRGLNDRQGVLFTFIAESRQPGSCAYDNASFTYEQVCDEPGIVIAWIRQRQSRHASHMASGI